MKLYEHIDLARKYSGPNSVNESAEKKADTVAVALSVAKHLSESKPGESKPVQLAGMPVSN